MACQIPMSRTVCQPPGNLGAAFGERLPEDCRHLRRAGSGNSRSDRAPVDDRALVEDVRGMLDGHLSWLIRLSR